MPNIQNRTTPASRGILAVMLAGTMLIPGLSEAARYRNRGGGGGAVQNAQSVIQQRIKRDKGRSTRVRFFSATTSNQGNGVRRVSGNGEYKQISSTSWRTFTYRADVNNRTDRVNNLYYRTTD